MALMERGKRRLGELRAMTLSEVQFLDTEELVKLRDVPWLSCQPDTDLSNDTAGDLSASRSY
jgi:hypothetical protein